MGVVGSVSTESLGFDKRKEKKGRNEYQQYRKQTNDTTIILKKIISAIMLLHLWRIIILDP